MNHGVDSTRRSVGRSWISSIRKNHTHPDSAIPPPPPRLLVLTAVAALCAGCGPGSIAWPSGEDQLRAALYQEGTEEGIATLTLVLSNGHFACDLPNEPDPIAQAQALLDFQIAACRENARHVLVTLYRGDGNDWVGAFPGDSHAHPSLIAPSRLRLSNASYYGIDEAALFSIDGFVRTYAVVDGADIQLLDIGDGGEVVVNAQEERMRGRFEFPSADISGSFRATECPPGSTMFALLQQSPVASCPSIETE